MNDLIRMKKLAGILTEGVMAVPSIGGSESDMQTAGTIGRNADYAAANAASSNLTEEADYDEVLSAIDALFGNEVDDIWESDIMGTLAQELMAENPTEEELHQIIATGSLPQRLQHIQFSAGDDFQFGSEMDEGMGMPSTQMVDEGVYTEIIQQKIQRAQELKDSMVDPEEVANIISDELEQDGWISTDIDKILNAIADELGGEADSDEDDTCRTCDGTGIGQHGDPDTSRCSSCGGSGVARGEYDNDDYEPDEYEPDDDYMGPLEESEEETDDGKEEVEEAFDLNNGYDDITFMKPGDFFPDGADSPVTRDVGPSGAKQGDNPEQKKMAVAEAHKELVYNYRKFLKESVKK